MGEQQHSKCQGLIFAHFLRLGEKLQLFAYVEWRVQVSRERFRVPDVCVIAGAEPNEDILSSAPFIVVEVLSPEDRISTMQSRIDDYINFGVPHIWLIDPRQKRAWICTREGYFEARDLALTTKNPEITLPLREIFDRLR